MQYVGGPAAVCFVIISEHETCMAYAGMTMISNKASLAATRQSGKKTLIDLSVQWAIDCVWQTLGETDDMEQFLL